MSFKTKIDDKVQLTLLHELSHVKICEALIKYVPLLVKMELESVPILNQFDHIK